MGEPECHSICALIEKLAREHVLAKEEYVRLISRCSEDMVHKVSAKAKKVAEASFGNKIFCAGFWRFQIIVVTDAATADSGVQMPEWNATG